MLPQAVSDYLNANRDRQIAMLSELIRFASVANVKDSPDSCIRAAHWLAARLTDMGASVELLPAVEGDAHDRPYVFAEVRAGRDLPTLLIYGHYDVQPAQPLELWTTPPFEATIRDGCLHGRGTSDDKGQVISNLLAVEAWIKAGQLPVNVKFLFEGEEEIGSPHAEAMLRRHGERLAADAVLVGDGGFFAPGVPSITYALRGLAYFEVVLTGPSRDIHSGSNGGAVTNPADALAKMIAAMHYADGRVAIEGFYDDVIAAPQAERNDWAALPFNESAYAASLGVTELAGGEKGYTVLQRCWERPTLDCNGLYGGYMGEGSKTIIPSKAGAKFSCRLVAGQQPERIVEAVRRFVRKHTPPGVTSELTVHAAGAPVLAPTDTPVMIAARAALEEVYGRKPVMVREGASVPITEAFQRLLKIQPIVMGPTLPSDAIHAPNEHAALEMLWSNTRTTAALLGNMGQAVR